MPSEPEAFRSAAPPLATVEWDAEGRVCEWSPEAERLFGWRADEVRGLRSWEWAFVHPDDRAQVQGVAEQITGAGARQSFSVNRNLARDGRILHCEWYNTALVDASGRLVAQYSLVLDVSARVEAEERASAALAAAERAIGRIARLQSLTAALSEALTPAQVAEAVMAEGVGAVRADAAVMAGVTADGEHLEVLAHRGYDAGEVAGWARFPLSTRVPLTDAVHSREIVVVPSVEERRRLYPDLGSATPRHPYAVAVPVVSEGEPLGVMGLSFLEPPAMEEEDRAFVLALARQCAQALRRARLYEVERHARAEAEEASRAKSAFVATMSHEIRTPINAVMGYADLLEMGLQGALSEGQRAYVARIRASSRHLLGLVNDVLDFARLEAGETAFEPEPVSLAEAVSDAFGMVLPQASGRGVALVKEPCDPGGAVLADPNRVRQVLLNLLANAIKFTAPGGRVIVRCVAGAGEGAPWAAVEVEDTGIGIAPEHLERIFEPFTQVDDSHTRESGGTGLGLAISRRFARLMGGEMTARSQPGAGSVFSLRLPAAGVPIPAADAPAPQIPTDPALEAAGRALEEAPETIVERWMARVLGDPAVPSARGLRREQVADHSTTLVTELGRSLAIEGSGGGSSAEADSSSIQRTIAALHGAQRARLGFSAAEIGREYQLLLEEVEGHLRRVLAAEDAEAAIPELSRMLDRAARIGVENHASVPPGERMQERSGMGMERE